MGLILSLEEEGLAAKWLIIIGISIILISIITECVLFFLQGGMSLGVRLDFPSMVWYFGLFLIFIGILLFVKNILLPPSETMGEPDPRKRFSPSYFPRVFNRQYRIRDLCRSSPHCPKNQPRKKGSPSCGMILRFTNTVS